MAASQGEDLLSQVVVIKQKNTLVARLDGVDVKALRETLDQVKNKLHSAVIVLATIQDDKVQIIAGVTQDLVAQVKAGELVNFVAQQVGGKGGGKPDMAMAGGTMPQLLPQALASVSKWLEERL
jgi:alanyl-tRNA synthetase